MKLTASQGTLENGDKFIKIDTRQFEGTKTLALFGESVKVERKDEAPYARVTEWYLNGTKKVSVSYSNK